MSLQKLALFLMNEKVKGDDSFWAPYLRMLPRPLTICEWSPEELKELQDENLVKKSQKRSANLRKFYDNLLNAIDGKLPVRETCPGSGNPVTPW